MASHKFLRFKKNGTKRNVFLSDAERTVDRKEMLATNLILG